MHIWKAYSCSIAGVHHRLKGRPCEDVVFQKQTDRYIFIGLADGQSGMTECIAGGKMALVTTSRFLVENVIDKDNLDNVTIAEELASRIKNVISIVAESNGISEKEYNSTLISILIDIKQNRFIIVHLGDGIIAGITNDNQKRIEVLSMPQYGLWGCTYLTTTLGAERKMKLIIGDLNKFLMLFAFSDGADSLYPMNVFPHQTAKLLESLQLKEIENELVEIDSRDDASMIAIVAENGSSV